MIMETTVRKVSPKNKKQLTILCELFLLIDSISFVSNSSINKSVKIKINVNFV